MGYAHKEDIEKAGGWLLAKLAATNPLKYSDIYNANTDLDGEGKKLGVDCFPVMVDCAVWQLKDRGFVTRRDLLDAPPLIDDNADYEIKLKDKQPAGVPQFVGMDL